MSKFIVIGLALLVIVVLITFYFKRNKKDQVILGKEMADASANEKKRIEEGNYGKSPLPDFDYSKWTNEQSLINPIYNELDSTLINLCDEFKNSDEDKRKEIRGSISQDNIYTLLEFSKRATIFGIRKNENSFITDGFIAIAMIESERCDYRDVLMTLGFLEYGRQKLNIQQDSIYKNTIKLSDTKTQQLIIGFSERPQKNSNFESMTGYTEIQTSNGSSFIETGYEKYNPKHDLAKMALDISGYLKTDKYYGGNITIREKIPPVWLEAENDKGIQKIIDQSTGCAYVSTYIRKELTTDNNVDQMLLVIINEFNENESSKILMQQCSKTPKDFSRLSFAEGDIFCLVIARSVRVGVKDIETNESIRRFELPFREIIKRNY